MFPNLGSFLVGSLKKAKKFFFCIPDRLHFCRDPEFLKAFDTFSG